MTITLFRANSRGFLSVEFKDTVLRKPLRVGLVFDSTEEGFSVNLFADEVGAAVVKSIKRKAEEIYGV